MEGIDQAALRGSRVPRSTFHYRSRKRDQAGTEARIKAICETRVRYGYRRVHVMLQREGWDINIKRTYWIYNEMSLQLRNKTPKRRVKAKLRDDRAPATRPNDVWAMDFVHDQLATGKSIRVLTVVDTFLSLLARGQSAVQLSGRGCGHHARTGLRADGVSEDNQRRSGQRVSQPRP